MVGADDGERGEPGPDGVGALAVDANSGEFSQPGTSAQVVQPGSPAEVPADSLTDGGQIWSCGLEVNLFDNGNPVGNSVLWLYNNSAKRITAFFAPTVIAVREPGTHTITAVASPYAPSFGTSCLLPGTKIDDLSVSVAPLG